MTDNGVSLWRVEVHGDVHIECGIVSANGKSVNGGIHNIAN